MQNISSDGRIISMASGGWFPTKFCENLVMSDLTVIILTRNEEENISDCLESVLGLTSKIFVVDSYSNDRTTEIIKGYADRGVQVVQHSFEGYASQWNWALKKLPISTKWVMKLDADERVTPALSEEIREVVSGRSTEEATGYYLRFYLYFFGCEVISRRFRPELPASFMAAWQRSV